jgi:ABC-type amino acid transport substrate-binding protein
MNEQYSCYHKGNQQMHFKIWAQIALLSGLLWSMLASAEMARFSVPEKAWLNNHQVTRVGVVEQTPPILFFPGGTTPQGLVADYLRALAAHLGVQIEIIQFADRTSLYHAMMRGEVDVIGDAAVGLEKNNALIYTQPYLSLQVALFGHEPLGKGGVDGLQGKVIALLEDELWIKDVAKLAPAAILKPYPDLMAALKAVAKGQAAAYIGISANAHYLLKREDFANIEELERLDLTYDIALASPQGIPELQSLLQKGLDRFSQQELLEIWRHWPGVERPAGYSNGISSLYGWIVVAILWTWLVAWLMRRYLKRRIVGHDARLKATIRRLRKREMHLKTKLMLLKSKALSYRSQVRQQRQRLGLLDDVMPSGIWVWDPSLQHCQWDEVMHSFYQRLAKEFEPTIDAVLECVHEEDRDRVAALYCAQPAEDETRLSYRILLPDGSIRWLLDYSHFNSDETGGGQRVGICWDISDYLVNVETSVAEL